MFKAPSRIGLHNMSTAKKVHPRDRDVDDENASAAPKAKKTRVEPSRKQEVLQRKKEAEEEEEEEEMEQLPDESEELGVAVQELIDAAHQVCPYSNATRGNIVVELRLA